MQHGPTPPPPPGYPGQGPIHTPPPPPGPPMPPFIRHSAPRPRGGASFWVAIILAVMLLFSIALNLVSLHPIISSMGDAGGNITEKVDMDVGDPTAKAKVAVITVEGVIMGGDSQSMFGVITPGPVTLLQYNLSRVKKDKSVRAVIIEINSPGGSVCASDTMYQMIKNFQTETKIPVVVHMQGIAASGGYYIAANADSIVASKTTITGSIGVIMTHFDISGALEYLRIKYEPIKSKPSKDAGSPFRKTTAEEQQHLQSIITEMYERFAQIVYEGRSKGANSKFNSRQDVIDTVGTGQIFTARQALDNGLVDKIGYFGTAYDEAIRLAEIDKARVVYYTYKQRGGFPFMLGGKAPASGDINLMKIDSTMIERLGTAKFLYMWQAGIRYDSDAAEIGAKE